MTGRELLAGVGCVNEELLAEALDFRPRRRSRVLWIASAAACLALTAVLIARPWTRIGEPDTAAVPAQEAENRPSAETDDTEAPAESVPGQSADIKTAEEGSAASGPMEGPGTEQSEGPMREMISGLPDMEAAPAADYAVENGAVWVSPMLCTALERYGDTVLYRVMVELFADGVQIDPAGERARTESERLADLGYIISLERVYRDGVQTAAYFTLHAKRAQLEAFSPDGGLGYGLFLYDERAEPITDWTGVSMSGGAFDAPADGAREAVAPDKLPADAAAVFGGSYLDGGGVFTVVLTEDTPENRELVCRALQVPEEGTRFVTGQYTLAYLTALLDRISADMAAGELPQAVSARLDEWENRVFVTLTAEDEAVRDRLAEMDEQGGTLEIEISGAAETE